MTGARLATPLRRAALAASLALAACGAPGPAPAPLRLERVEPATGTAGSAAAIRIVGSGFRPRISADFGGGRVSSDPRFRATLGGVALRAVVYVDEGRLDAEVPAELGAGRHALSVVDPDDREAVLADAFVQAAAPGGPCGDGVVDAAAGETCDPADPGGAGCCDPATCTFVAAGAADPQGRCLADGPCRAAACGAGGACLRGPIPDGAACGGDGLFCTGEERCEAGACRSAGDPCAAPAACSEALDRCVACGDGVVDGAAGEQCDPGAPASGGCCDPVTCRFAAAGEPDPQGRCVAGGDCLAAACDGAGGCAVGALPDGTACTNDGLYCSGPEACQGGVCTSPGDPCPSPAACNEIVDRCVVCGDGAVDLAGGESCDPADPSGDGCCDPLTCRFAPAGAPDPQGRCAAPDGCSTAACDGAGACALLPRPDGAACADDGRFCSGAEVCRGGACASAGDPCGAPFTCSEAAAACVRCGDGIVQAAAGEQCDAGGGADPCCDPVTCRFAPAGRACDDGRFCTAADACDGAGACLGGESPCPREVVAEAGFEGLAPGEPLWLDPGWTAGDGGHAAVAPGCASAAALGPADGALSDGAASLLAAWTVRPFTFVDPALAAVRVEAAFETDAAGDLTGDRVGVTIGGSPSLYDFLGVTADTRDAGGAGLFLTYSSGALTRSVRLAALPPLAPGAWYRLRAVLARGDGSLRVEASLAALDEACAERGLAVVAPPVDTSSLAAPPRAAYLSAPVLVPALANGGRAAGAVDLLRLGLDHGGAATACSGCDEAGRRCAAPAGAACASDGAHCTGAERCDGLGFCAGEGDPCARTAAGSRCDEAADACAAP